MTSPKTITSNRVRVCFIEVPEDANRFHVFNDDRPYLSMFIREGTDRCYLPSGNWKILGDSGELAEDQMKEICEPWHGFYKCYTMKKGVFIEIEKSYASLKEANGIIDSKRYVVLIEDKN